MVSQALKRIEKIALDTELSKVAVTYDVDVLASVPAARIANPYYTIGFRVAWMDRTLGIVGGDRMRRLATPGDFEAVYTIYMHPEVVPYLGFDPMSQEDFRSVYDALLASGCFYVFEVAGRVQGFYRATRQEGRARHVVYLGTLAVAPEAKGSGLARAMVAQAIAKLREEGITRIELTVEADNPRAVAFYEKLGFEHEGTLRAAYKRSSDQHYVDERFMALLL